MSDPNPSKPVSALTAREQSILILGLQSLKSGDIQIDYDMLAAKAGLSNAKSARAMWWRVRGKTFGAGANEDEDESATPVKTTKPRTPAKPKATREMKTPKSVEKKPVVKEEKDVKEDDKEEDQVDGPAKEADGDSTLSTAAVNGDDGQAAASTNTNHATDEPAEKKKAPVLKPASKPKPAAKAPASPATPDGSDGSDMKAAIATPLPATAPATAKATPSSTPKKRKTKAEKDAEAAANGEEKPTPKKRKTKAEKDAEAATAANGEDMEGDADNEKPSPKKQKTPAKRAVKSEPEDGVDDNVEAAKHAAEKKKTISRKPSAKQLEKKAQEAQEAQEQLKATQATKKAADKAEQAKADAEKTRLAALDEIDAVLTGKMKLPVPDVEVLAASQKPEVNGQASKATVPNWGTSINGQADKEANGTKIDQETDVASSAATNGEGVSQ